MPKPFNILFIGNSFTARNDLPGLISQLAAAGGHVINHKLISAGGASLRRHWNAGEALKAIRTRHFDHVVLQEQSTLPIKSSARMHDSIRLFDTEIKAAGSKTVLYLTWARRNQPEAQQAITDAYSAIARELGSTIVPVGVAWQRLLATHQEPALHDRDQSHPTLAGSYLAACVFFGVLLRKSPVGSVIPLPGLPPADQRLLQQSAWSAIRT